MKAFKYTINGNEYSVEIVKEEGQEVELTVNGTSYTVAVDKKDEDVQPKKVTRPAAAPVSPTGAPVVVKKPVSGAGVIKAPLPGVILHIDVKIGDTVKVGEKLLTLEAMKMENTIPSDVAGKVLDIKVEPGTTVMEGTDLVVIG
jgi:glutaconyl-CoA/methylmalonyl-CoA decarboxylase subunit gamma